VSNGPVDDKGADTNEMARWQGQIEATIDSIRLDMEGRDKRYTERAEAQDKAVSAALAAQKEAVAAALAASDKAVEKAEATAEKWRASANEWRGAMSDRDRELPSRREVTGEVMRLEATIKPLTAYVAAQSGPRALTPSSVAAVLATFAVAVGLFFTLTRAKPTVVVPTTPTVTVTTPAS
jgi:hypothetical protein